MDKNAEVLVCGASIMKDVWEIRLREYRQKQQLEEERIQKSALKRINQDYWQARMSSKIKTPKRLERKAKLPEESSLDAHNDKKTHLGKPQGFQSSQIQRKLDLTKTTKANKLALLCHLNENCPVLMVWAKSWKFSQPLPQPEESPCAFDWGQSWKFLNVQPSTNGKPWFDLEFDANNNMSSNNMFLSEKLCKVLSSECIQQDLVTPEWENSWIFTQKRKECHENTNESDCNKCTNLWGDQNEESASDWKESWKSTKPVRDGDVKSDLIQPTANKEKQPELSWNNSWMHFKKQLHMKPKSTNNSSWSESWRVAKTILETEAKSTQSQAVVPEEVHPNICDVIMNVSREMNHTIPLRDAQLSEWEKSWVTIKNMSEYKEEIYKEVEVKAEMLKPDNFKQPIEHVKFNILALPRGLKRQEMLNFSEQTDWNDSWKMLKCQHREERALRKWRPSQFAQTLSEWADSWRFTNLTLNQDDGLWQQGWSANAKPRPMRRVQENEDIPYNGPAGVRTWVESWRSTRRQPLMERQAACASTQPVGRHAYARSVADWEQSWMSSAHQRHHDRPSMTAWNDSWRFSNLEDLQPEHAWFEKSMELIRALNAFSRSFDSLTFKEQNHSNEWNDSWRVKKRFDGPGIKHLMKNEILDWDNSWMFTSTEFSQRQEECYSDVKNQSVQIESRSEWGRSWKMSNPQPTKNIASWVDAKSKSFSAQDLILWSKHKHIYYLPSASPKDLKLKIWAKSWRFVKIDLGGTDEDEFVIMTKTTKIGKEMYSDIDEQNPHMKRWSDACKMAKTQSRAKSSVKTKSGNVEDEDEEVFAEWMESWKLSNDLKTREPSKLSLRNWKNSWKFLLDPNVPVNGPKTRKSRQCL